MGNLIYFVAIIYIIIGIAVWVAGKYENKEPKLPIKYQIVMFVSIVLGWFFWYMIGLFIHVLAWFTYDYGRK